MKQYHNLIREVLEHGTVKSDRTGTGTISMFGAQMRFNLAEGFPLVTTKKMFTKGIIAELLWFLEGSTDERRLAEIQYGLPREQLIGKQTIWTANADAQGKDLGYENTDLVKELGPVYGRQWRKTPQVRIGFDAVEGETVEIFNIDQIAQVIESIKTNPDSRRHIVSAWNVAEIDDMALPPCHYGFQFYVVNGKLSCMFHMRSTDVLLGLPYNLASYALLTMMVAQVCNLKLGELIYTGGDVHIYSNHVEQCKLQLSREPRPLPTMTLDPNITCLDDFTMDSFTLTGYDPHPTIKAEMAV